MFELREKDLTWEVVGSWTAKDSDAEYDVRLPNLKARLSDRDSRFYGHYYTLKGHELLYIIKAEEKNPDNSFDYVKIFSLSEFSEYTRLQVRENHSLLNLILNGSAFQSVFVGESFFFESEGDSVPFHEALWVHYPKGKSARDAVEFCDRVKARIRAAKN